MFAPASRQEHRSERCRVRRLLPGSVPILPRRHRARRSRRFLTFPGRSRDECGTIEGSDLRPMRVRGQASARRPPPDRLFEVEEAVLHVMGVQIASEKRRNPWTSAQPSVGGPPVAGLSSETRRDPGPLLSNGRVLRHGPSDSWSFVRGVWEIGVGRTPPPSATNPKVGVGARPELSLRRNAPGVPSDERGERRARVVRSTSGSTDQDLYSQRAGSVS